MDSFGASEAGFYEESSGREAEGAECIVLAAYGFLLERLSVLCRARMGKKRGGVLLVLPVACPLVDLWC
jgi:hypothetical protein